MRCTHRAGWIARGEGGRHHHAGHHLAGGEQPHPTGVFMLLDATPATPSGPVAKRTSYARRSRVRAREADGLPREIIGVVVPTIGHGLPEQTDVAADGALQTPSTPAMVDCSNGARTFRAA